MLSWFWIVECMLTLCSQPHCFDLFQVIFIAADCAIHITSLFSIPITSRLALDTCWMPSSIPNTSTPHTKAISQFWVPSDSIGTFCGACASFLLMLMCFRPSEHFGVSISSLEFCNLSLLSQFRTVLLTFLVVLVSVSMLSTSLCTVYLSAWSPKPFTSPQRHIFGPIGEFGTFGFFWLVFLTLFQSLCTCVCVVNAPATFPKPSALSLHQECAPIGELGFFLLIWGHANDFCHSCSCFRIDLITLHMCAHAQCIPIIPEPLWLLWAWFLASTRWVWFFAAVPRYSDAF